MIIGNEKVRMHCDEDGCEESLRVSLVLLPTGGWGVRFPASAINKWQLLVDRQNPMKPYSGRCPKHSQSRIVPAHAGLVVSA